jgi:hypothetical protein
MRPKLPENYDPVRRKYLKLCPVCDKDLWARKNQDYHPWCKVWLNNHKASLYRLSVKEEEKARKGNFRVLKLISIIGYLDRPIFKIILDAVGLNFECMTRIPSEFDEEIYETCGYRIEVFGDDANSEVVISKLKNEESCVDMRPEEK